MAGILAVLSEFISGGWMHWTGVVISAKETFTFTTCKPLSYCTGAL
jgi:hypothetical protein